MKNLVMNNIGLKLIALLLAIITWFYIVVELQKGAVEEREVLQRILPYRMVSKQVPVKLDLVGEPPKGFAIDKENLAITPSACIIVGPKSLLEKLTTVSTQPVDVSKMTKTLTKDISVISPIKGMRLKDRFVSITIPIIATKD